jgi:hypothetical protein
MDAATAREIALKNTSELDMVLTFIEAAAKKGSCKLEIGALSTTTTDLLTQLGYVIEVTGKDIRVCW